MSRSARTGDDLDPRVERSRRVIRQAALDELAERGYGGFTIESVAARAGVGKSTVYRHWSNGLALITDALETLNEQPRPDAGDGAPRQRVERLLQHLTEALADPVLSATIPALVEAAEHEPAVRTFYRDYSARRRQSVVDAITAGIAAGDFAPGLDPDLASLALVGPIFYCRLITGQPFDPARISELVDHVLGPARTA
ncbi:TetR/AcrR family transcriptional regulator C-terminal ligand-binding domain-containing protein [Pseudonocardia sichuanensis]